MAYTMVPIELEWDDNTLKEVVDKFHYAYYHKQGWDYYHYLGYQIKQCPFDLQIYQELVFHLRPSFILQTGVAGGGSLLYFATLLDLIQADANALVIGVDITLTPAALTLNHPRIRLIEGNSVDLTVISQIKSLLPTDGGLVILDSDHNTEHVSNELAIYHQFVGLNSYLIVEDTNVGGHPVLPKWRGGPYEAVDAFLPTHPDFVENTAIWSGNLFSFHRWLAKIR